MSSTPRSVSADNLHKCTAQTAHNVAVARQRMERGRFELSLQGWHQAFPLSMINCDQLIALCAISSLALPCHACSVHVGQDLILLDEGNTGTMERLT